MKDSKLISLLSSFSKEELNRFEEFLSSPYFNKRDALLEIYNILKPFLIKKELDDITEDIFQGNFNAKLYSNYATRLLKQAEQFLAIEALQKNENVERQLLLKELSERRLEKHFESQYKKRITAAKSTKLSLNYYYDEFKFQYLYHEFQQKLFKSPDKKNYQSILNDFDSFLFLKKISLECEKIAFEKVYNFSLESAFLEQIDEIAGSDYFKDNLLAQLYYLAFKMYQSDNDNDSFYLLKKLLFQEPSKLAERELKELLTMLVNYSNRQVNKGDKKFLSISLSIYDVMNDNDVLLQEEASRFQHFSNALAIAYRDGNFEWATKFIDESIKWIDEKYRNATEHFGLGIYFFYKKDFDRATDEFNQAYQVSDAIPFYGINHRYMYIRSLYESDKEYTERTMEQFNLFKQWAKRQKRYISEQFSNAYFHSTGILIKLYRLKHLHLDRKYNTPAKRKKELEKIEKELNKYPIIMAKEWLEEKLEEMN